MILYSDKEMLAWYKRQSPAIRYGLPVAALIVAWYAGLICPRYHTVGAHNFGYSSCSYYENCDHLPTTLGVLLCHFS